MAKVLIVEDTEVNRLVLSNRLAKLGYEVLVAVDGEEGLAKAAAEIPDIILMDMYLPGIDGQEATQTLKKDEATKHIPIIALTAHAVTQTREAVVRIGCDEYEMKPINFDRLVSKIEALLGQTDEE